MYTGKINVNESEMGQSDSLKNLVEFKVGNRR